MVWSKFRIGLLFLSVISPLVAQTIPHTEAETLSGKKITLPDAAAGHPAIFVIGFSRAGGDSSRKWGKELEKDFPDRDALHIFSVAILQDAPALARGMIKHGMRSGTPKAEQDSFIVLDKDEDSWKKLVEFSDANDAYVLVVDPAGTVRWRTHSKAPDSQTIAALREALAGVGAGR